MCGDVGAASQGRAGHGGQIERSPEVMEARCYPLLWLEGGVAGEPCAGHLLRESPSLGVAEHGSGASLDVAREVRSRVLVRNFSQVSQGALFVVSVTAYVNKSVSWQGIVNLPG